MSLETDATSADMSEVMAASALADSAFSGADFGVDAFAGMGDSAGAIGDFSDLVEGGAEVLAEVNESMKTGEFGSLDVNDFTDFSVSDYTPSEGEYTFSVEQKWLRESTGVMKMVSAISSRGQGGGLKVTLYRGKIRLSTFNQAAFGEIFLPVFSGLRDLEQEVSFIFDLGVLAKIASSFGDAVIGFTYDAGKSLLTLQAGQTRLELSTYPPEDFVNYHDKLEEPTLISRLDPVAFKSALKYAGTFVKKDDISANLAIVDIRDGLVIGGSASSVGLYSSKFLEGLNFKVKYEVLGVLEKLLARFHATNTHLFDAGNFYLLRDENMFLGFEKSQFEFPSVDTFRNAELVESLLVPRPELIGSLNKLSVVSIDRDMQVCMSINGSGKDVEFSLSTTDSSGRKSTDRLQAHRSAEGDFTPADLKKQVFYVGLHALLKICGHFETANIAIKMNKEGATRAIFIEDGDDETYSARTVMIVMTPEQMEKRIHEQKMSTLERATGRAKGEKEDSEEEAV